MKIKYLILAALVLAFAATGFAQKKADTETADAVVKNLYEAQKAGTGPFFQTKNRALVDRYFAKDLADMIWKDAVDSKGEAGAIDFDPLFNAQDTEITNFVVGKAREAGGDDNAFVDVTFKNFGKSEKVSFEVARGADKKWKITGIFYSDGEDLASTLRYAQDAEIRKEYDSQPFKGDYMVGNAKCAVIPTKGGFITRVQCDGEDGYKLYQVDGSETETAYVPLMEDDQKAGRFIFKNGETSGKFIDAKGKEVKVVRMNVESSDVKSVDFLNYTYKSPSCAEDLGISREVKVTGGKFKSGDNFYNVKDNTFTFADINGDGNADAVVAIECGNSAGTFRAFEIHAFTVEDGNAKTLATLDLNQVTEDFTKHYPNSFVFSIPPNGVRIDDGKLTLDVLTDGSFAMPENVSTFKYKLSSGKFKLEDKPAKRSYKP